MNYIKLFSILCFTQMQAQYVMEWESPLGLEIEEFADSNSPMKTSGHFDINMDGQIEIVSKDENDNYYFYDAVTHELRWSWLFNNISGDVRYSFVGFAKLTTGGFKEAIFYQNNEGSDFDDYCLIVNTQNNQIFEIALDSEESFPGILSHSNIFAESISSSAQMQDKLLLQFSDHFEIWGDGTDEINSDSELELDPVISEYKLNNSYPNPFNPSTTVSYSLEAASHVKISIYDIEGKLVEILQEGIMTSGIHTINWNPEVSSGQYFVQMEINNEQIETNKVLFVK